MGKALENFFTTSSARMEGDMDGMTSAADDESLRRNVRRFLLIVAGACVVTGVLYLISFVKSL